MEIEKMKTRGKYLTSTALKVIAVILMVFDHIHQMWALNGAPVWLTWLGRPVFPIFLFVMSESFHYTHNRKRLMLRLLLASLLMSVINMLVPTFLPNENIVLMNNAFSTFFMATLYMLFWDLLTEGIKAKQKKKILLAIVVFIVPILTAVPTLLLTAMDPPPMWLVRALLLVPNIMMVEGGFLMVVLGLLFYVFRGKHRIQILVLAAVAAITWFAGSTSFQWMMVFAAIPIYFYNGERGRGMKNFFYIFYPAHIYLLYIIATLTQ